jgi:hypothetical protein
MAANAHTIIVALFPFFGQSNDVKALNPDRIDGRGHTGYGRNNRQAGDNDGNRGLARTA